MPSVWIETRHTRRGKNYLLRWELTLKPWLGKRPKGVNTKPTRLQGSESCGPAKAYAFKRQQEVLEDLYAGRTPSPRVRFISVQDFVAECLSNSRSTKATNTAKNFEAPALNSFAAYQGRTPLSMVDKAALFAWRDHLLQEEYSPNTVRMWLRALSAALGYAEEMEYIRANPFTKVKTQTLFPAAVEVARYLSHEEIAQLLPALPRHVAQAFYFILQTGLRHGELLNLDWKMIHRPANGPWVMEVTSATAHGLTSGHKVKTRRAREVEIPEAARMPEVIGEPKTSGPVFGWRTRDVLESALRVATFKLKMGRVRTHDARHTWATNFMYKTGDVFQLMYRGGWASMTSAKVYQHLRKRGEPVELFIFPHYTPTKAIVLQAAG